LFLVVAVIALIGWLYSIPSAAQRADRPSTCKNHNLDGNYTYIGFGTIGTNPVGLPPGSYNTAARLVLTEKGEFTVEAMTSYGGTLVPEYFEGTYEVGPGCAITYSVQFPGAPAPVPAVFAYTTTDRGEARGISLLPGTNVSYLTIKQ
jgi:hypothetical protein